MAYCLWLYNTAPLILYFILVFLGVLKNCGKKISLSQTNYHVSSEGTTVSNMIDLRCPFRGHSWGQRVNNVLCICARFTFLADLEGCYSMMEGHISLRTKLNLETSLLLLIVYQCWKIQYFFISKVALYIFFSLWFCWRCLSWKLNRSLL